MKCSVCLPIMYRGMSAADALLQVKEAGAEAFEIWSWWDQDLDALERAKRETGLEMSAMCTKMIPLNDPARRSEFLSGLTESIAVARWFGCPTLIAQVGQNMEDVSRDAQRASIVEGLRAAAPLLEAENVVLAIEPLNDLVDHKGYYLTRSDEAFGIVREVNSPAVKVLFDVYHQQITEGNLIANLTKGIEWIAHIHIAGVPGRHAPLRGSEINMPAVLAALKKLGYQGYIGLEYLPLEEPAQGIREMIDVINREA